VNHSCTFSRPTDTCEGLHKSKGIDQPRVGSLIVVLWLGATHTCPIDRCAIEGPCRSSRCYWWTGGHEHGWLMTYLFNRLTDGLIVYSWSVRPMVL